MTTTQEMTVEYCRTPINNEWDTFVNEINGEIFQTSVWANIGTLNNTHRIIIKKDNEIVAGCQFKVRHYPVIGNIGYIEQGPCIKYHDPLLYEMVVREIKRATSANRLLYMVIDLHYNLGNLVPCLEKNGFVRKDSSLPPNPIVKSTLLLSLDQPLENILSQMKKERRKNINKGLRSPIEHQLGCRDDIKTFFELMLATCERRKTKPLINIIETFYKIWDALSPMGWIVMHLAKVDGKIICAAIGLTAGQTYRSVYWGWNGEYADYNISDTIGWFAIRWAKEQGFNYYDFVHLDPLSADAIASEAPIPEYIKTRTHFGSTFYKMQFGGYVVHYPGLYCIFSNKLKYYLVHVVGCKLIQLKPTRLLVRKIQLQMKRVSQ